MGSPSAGGPVGIPVEGRPGGSQAEVAVAVGKPAVGEEGSPLEVEGDMAEGEEGSSPEGEEGSPPEWEEGMAVEQAAEEEGGRSAEVEGTLPVAGDRLPAAGAEGKLLPPG